jgi:hypothetical protein
MTPPYPRPDLLRALVKAMLLGAGVPLALALALNARRPDLFQEMFEHGVGVWMLCGVGVLSLGAAGAFLAAELVPFAGRTRPWLLNVVGFLLCTLPALITLLFGPIAIAFMYGAAG